MGRFSLEELLAARAGEGFALYERYSNPRFVEILRILGFDREWAGAEGAYLYERDGTRYLDWLGGFGRLLPGVSFVPFNDLEALEAELAREDVAVFVTEPVQGQGVILPDPDYLSGAQRLCRRYGTLFCVDEVQTGFGRTGRMFALDHWGLEPDLLTVAKSLSGGYVPVGALLMSTAVYDAVFDSLEHSVCTARRSRPMISRW